MTHTLAHVTRLSDVLSLVTEAQRDALRGDTESMTRSSHAAASLLKEPSFK